MYLDFSLALFLFLLSVKVRTEEMAKGVIELDCRERYLAVQVHLNNGSEPHFKAIDTIGVHPITKEYGPGCGYTYELFCELGIAELKASYFSCHTGNQGDVEFTFNFSVIMTDQHGEEATYAVSKACTLPLPWSPREVICELDYMEVHVDGAVPHVSTGGTVMHQQWDDGISSAYTLASSGWQLIFLKEGQMSTDLSLDEAREQGYRLHFTPGRVLLRMPYGKPLSHDSLVNGVPVEVVHAVLFSRQRWIVVIFDLVAACSKDVGFFDGTSLHWQVPIVMFPLSSHTDFETKNISIGVHGTLLDPQVTADRGYSLSTGKGMVDIGIPYGAEGGHRQSFVLNNTYWEFYLIYLYYEGVFMDSFHTENRHRHTKVLMTQSLPHVPITINQTVIEQRAFTLYVGNFPSDVVLMTVTLNGHEFNLVEATQHGYTIVKAPHANGTHAYIIKVPFEDPMVLKSYFTEGVLQYLLSVNFTFNIMLQENYFFHLTSLKARIHDVYPPSFSGLCQEHGIVFKLAHEEFHHMWDITIGNNLLTELYAVRQGYLMANDSQGILLDVPLFTPGYLYEDINLNQFFGTFEILSRDAKTLEIQKHSVKRCPFPTTELIGCSTGGVMTVVTSVVKSIPKADPQRTTLLDTTCKPKETDETRVLFEFDLRTCGTRMKVKNDLMIFENTIMFEQEPLPSHRPVITRDATFRLAVQCSYPVKAVNMDVAFASSVPGRGSVGEAKPYETALAKPIMLPAPEAVTTASVPITPRIKTPPTQRPAKFMRVHSHHSAKSQSSEPDYRRYKWRIHS
ncbi:uncharacterized protein LOC121690492 [Alosa sapidissima]|uniref:uncharacterized protein LOC121690492 n=1 Tax=Alosa sapidissima TaxID=34773 RepID=UPI001C08553E|nr:uncharacterized protein LOC121690492 [Alosa sapidissima]